MACTKYQVGAIVTASWKRRRYLIRFWAPDWQHVGGGFNDLKKTQDAFLFGHQIGGTQIEGPRPGPLPKGWHAMFRTKSMRLTLLQIIETPTKDGLGCS